MAGKSSKAWGEKIIKKFGVRLSHSKFRKLLTTALTRWPPISKSSVSPMLNPISSAYSCSNETSGSVLLAVHHWPFVRTLLDGNDCIQVRLRSEEIRRLTCGFCARQALPSISLMATIRPRITGYKNSPWVACWSISAPTPSTSSPVTFITKWFAALSGICARHSSISAVRISTNTNNNIMARPKIRICAVLSWRRRCSPDNASRQPLLACIPATRPPRSNA